MTQKQLIALMSSRGGLWAGACKTQGWDEKDRALRLAVIGEALGRSIESTDEIDAHDDFTRVKNRLLRLADSLPGAHEDGDLSENQARTRRWKIEQQMRCVAIYPTESPRGADRAEDYVRELVQDLCDRMGVERGPFASLPVARLVGEAPSGLLERLVITLSNRLHNKRTGMRVVAGHSLHEMAQLAGVRCDCRICAGKVPPPRQAPTPTIYGDAEESWTHEEAPAEPVLVGVDCPF